MVGWKWPVWPDGKTILKQSAIFNNKIFLKHKLFAKVGSNFCQIQNKPIFAKVSKAYILAWFRQIWSHWKWPRMAVEGLNSMRSLIVLNKMAIPVLFFLILVSFVQLKIWYLTIAILLFVVYFHSICKHFFHTFWTHLQMKKIEGFSGIRPRVVRVEGDHQGRN